jgi:hypothetical protein
MRVVITIGELIELGAWSEACDLLGLNPYAIAEDMIDGGYEVVLTPAQALHLRLIQGFTAREEGS